MINRSQRQVYNKLFGQASRRAFSNAVATASDSNISISETNDEVTSLWEISEIGQAEAAKKR